MTTKTRHLWLLVLALLVSVVACGSPSSKKVGTDYSGGGDLSGPLFAATVVGLQGKALPAPTGTNTAPIWSGSAFSWGSVISGASVSGTGLWYSTSGSLDAAAATLTGDVSQGAISGNNVPLTVTGLQTHAVASATPTEGQFLIQGASSWAPTSISGTDVSASVTTPGLLTVTGIQGHGITLATGFLNWTGSAWAFSTGASIFTPGVDIAGNGTSTATNQYVSSISYSSAAAGGTVAIKGTGTAFQVAANNTGFVFSQATQNSSASPPALVFQPQFQAGSDEGSAAANTPAPFDVNLGVPYTTTHAGAETAFYVQRNGHNVGAIGPDPNVPTTYGMLWLGYNVVPSATNYTITSDAVASTYFNAPASIFFQIANANYVEITSSTLAPSSDVGSASLGLSTQRWSSVNAGPTGFQVWHANTDTHPVVALGDTYLEFGPGGTNPLDVSLVRSNSGTATLSNAANGNATFLIGGTSSANELSLASSNTTISVVGTGASGAQSASLTINPQATNGGAGSYSGNVVMNFAPPVSTATTYGMLVTQLSGSQAAGLGPYSNAAGYGGVWGGAGPYNDTNYAIISNATATYVNGGSGGFVYVGFGGVGGASYEFSAGSFFPLVTNNNNLGTNADYWLGVYSGQFLFPSGLGTHGLVGWAAAAASGAGQDTYVSAQNAVASGTSNGGNAWLMSGGANGGTGLPGNVVASIGGNTSKIWTPTGSAGTFQVLDGNGIHLISGIYSAASGGTSGYSALWLGQGTTSWSPGSSNYTFANSSTGLYINAVSLATNFAIGSSVYMELTTSSLSPSIPGQITDGNSTNYWGANYTADRQTLAVSGSATGAVDVIKRRTYLALGGTSTVVVPSGTGPTLASSTGMRLEFHWQARDPTSANDVAGGVEWAVCHNNAGTVTCSSNSLWSGGTAWCTGSILPTVVVGTSGTAVTLTGTCAGAGASTVWEADVLSDNQ